MGGFDVSKMASMLKADKIAGDVFETIQNGQNNKTKRHESDNKREVEFRKESAHKIEAAARVLASVGTVFGKTGDAYKSVQTAKAEQKKADAEYKKAEAKLENAENVREKNKQDHEKNMHKIDTEHTQIMDAQQKNFDKECQKLANVGKIVDNRLREREILHQKVKNGTFSEADISLIKEQNRGDVEIVKSILESRK